MEQLETTATLVRSLSERMTDEKISGRRYAARRQTDMARRVRRASQRRRAPRGLQLNSIETMDRSLTKVRREITPRGSNRRVCFSWGTGDAFQ